MVSLSSPPLLLSLPLPLPSPTRRPASTVGFLHSRPPRPQNPELALLRRAPRLRIPDPAPFPGGSRGGLFGNGVETCSQSFLTFCHSADFYWMEVGDNYQAMVIQCAEDSNKQNQFRIQTIESFIRVVIATHGDHLSALSKVLGGIAAANETVATGRIKTEGCLLVTTVFLRNLHTELQPDYLQDFFFQTYFAQDEHYRKVYFGKYDHEEFVNVSAKGESTSVLLTNTPDKPGLLATIFSFLHGRNITLESAEMHTCRGSAVNKFIISYQGLALTQEAAQDLTRELWYCICIGE